MAGSFGIGGGIRDESGGVAKISKQSAEVIRSIKVSQFTCVFDSKPPAFGAGPELSDAIVYVSW